MDSELFKNRSVGSCLNDAFDLFRTNFKTLFRRLWLSAVVLSLLLAATILLGLQNPSNVAGSVSLIILYLLDIAGYVWFYSIIISLLNGKSVKMNLPRASRLALLLIGVFVLVTLIFAIAFAGNMVSVMNPEKVQTASVKLAVGTMAFLIVLAVACLPFAYSAMKYCIETESKVWSIFKKPYVTGLRHWGYLFLTALLTEIISAVISMVISLPLYVILFCYYANSNGMSFGDPSGLSAGFGILAFLTAAVCSFVDLFVRPWLTFTFFYAYGSIEEKEKGKRESKELTVDEEQSTDLEVTP